MALWLVLLLSLGGDLLHQAQVLALGDVATNGGVFSLARPGFDASTGNALVFIQWIIVATLGAIILLAVYRLVVGRASTWTRLRRPNKATGMLEHPQY